MIPAQYRVIVTKRPKLACRACAGTVVQAPAPARLIDRILTEFPDGRLGNSSRVDADVVVEKCWRTYRALPAPDASR